MVARELKAAGHAIVSRPEEADIIVVNTCAVTAQAESKTRHAIRSVHRDNPDAQVAVLGCYATLRPEASEGFPGVSWVIRNCEKEHTVDALAATHSSFSGRQSTDGCVDTLRTRAFVKVQDGCDNHCTYCIVRSLRGPSRSRPLDSVIRELRRLVNEAGCREAVLTGASLGAYGRDLGLPDGLRTVVQTILSETDLARLRLSSIEPWDIDEAFFDLWNNPRLCRQIHLPLQSGCDATLRRMGRPITSERFGHLVKSARDTIPDVAITTDVLVGFPGESEEAFWESHEFVRDMAFAKLHVFPFSPRPGTPAVKLKKPVPPRVREERAGIMRKLGTEQRRRFQRRFLDRELDVLWEKQWKDGRWTGWTDNYIRVAAPADGDLGNRILQARLLSLENGCVEGEVIP
jgi:threonylcarbamoyladenosine tRNA methylthiotransferase MtaB